MPQLEELQDRYLLVANIPWPADHNHSMFPTSFGRLNLNGVTCGLLGSRGINTANQERKASTAGEWRNEGGQEIIGWAEGADTLGAGV